MALRLRRGTDAERQLITPVEGELIYTTDTKSVYIGDGTTAGGIVISGEIGLGDLAEVDLSTPPTVGQALVWDGTKFVPDDIDGTAPETLSVFDLTDVFKVTDPDVGDTLAWDGLNFTPAKILSSIFELNDVAKVTDPDPGNVLIWDGANFVPDRIRIIEGDDSSIMVDTATNTFTGNFVGDGSGLDLFGTTQEIDVIGNLEGNVLGDLTGSVFADDSNLVIDGLTGDIYANVIKGSNIFVEPSSAGPTNFHVTSNDERANLRLVRRSELPISDTSILGTIFFDEFESGVERTRALIGSTTNAMFFGIDETGAFNNPSKYLTFTKDGNFGIGTFEALAKVEVKDGSIYLNDSRDLNLLASPLQGEMTYDSVADAITFRAATEWRNVVSYSATTNVTDIPGSVVAIGDVSAAAFKGSLMADDSSTIVDAISGNITAPGFVQFGSFTKPERDSLSALNGMVIYNTTSNKFQGYQNGAWINLDDGLADP
jgi:hypothetical protein